MSTYTNLDVRTAEITAPISSIDYLSQTGLQLARPDGVPISRIFYRYTVPSQPEELYTVPVRPEEQEAYSAGFYYTRSRYGTVEIFASRSDAENESEVEQFFEWDRSLLKARFDEFYYHRPVGAHTWSRPYSVYENAILTPPSNTDGPLTTGVTQSVNPLVIWYYHGYPPNFEIQYRLPTQAIGVTFEADGLWDIQTGVGDGTWVSAPSLVLATTPMIRVRPINPSQTLPTYFRFRLWGERFSSSFTMLDTVEEEVLTHPESTSLSQRYQPPGHSFPDNFWNSVPSGRYAAIADPSRPPGLQTHTPLILPKVELPTAPGS